jgi:hypothetical protein
LNEIVISQYPLPSPAQWSEPLSPVEKVFDEAGTVFTESLAS